MKKTLGILLAAAMLAAALAGCGGGAASASVPAGNPGPAPASTPAADPVQLAFFGFKTGGEIGAREELIAKFNAENPDIVVSYEGLSNGGGYQDVLTTRLASGQGDDVFLANPNYLGKLQEAGYVEDLAGMAVVSNYSDLVKDLMTIDGKVPGLAMELAVFGMYTNNDVLKAHGIGAPTNYAEFMAACETLKAAGVTPVVASAKDGTGIGVFSSTKGLDGLYSAPDKAAQIAAINEGTQSLAETMIDGLELVSELKAKGYINAEQALVMAPAQDDITEFVKGNTAFMTGGGWSLAAIQEAAPGADITLGGVPVQEKDALVMVNAGVRVCINKSCENKEAAQRFVEFLTRTENLDEYVASQNAFTPLKDGTSTSNPAMAAAAERISAGRMITWVDPAFSKLDPWALSKEYAANILGGSSVETAVKDMNTAVANAIKLA